MFLRFSAVSDSLFLVFTFTRVNGLIDNINLSLGGVLVTIEDQTVTGHKSFVSNVIVQGDLYVDRYINDIDIVVLLTDTVGQSRSEVKSNTHDIG